MPDREPCIDQVRCASVFDEEASLQITPAGEAEYCVHEDHNLTSGCRTQAGTILGISPGLPPGNPASRLNLIA